MHVFYRAFLGEIQGKTETLKKIEARLYKSSKQSIQEATK